MKLQPRLTYRFDCWRPTQFHQAGTFSSLPYSERLALLFLNLLEFRWIRFNLIYRHIYLTTKHPTTPAMFSLSTHQVSALDLKCHIFRNQPTPQTDSYQLPSDMSMYGILSPLPCALHSLSQYSNAVSSKSSYPTFVKALLIDRTIVSRTLFLFVFYKLLA
jgi:hypothetical protein